VTAAVKPSTSEPTFVIAGGQRCGTTTLYHLLDEHPEVYLAKPVRPEPKFFIRDPEPGRGRDWYLRTWFAGPEAASARARGEKSTTYLEAEGAARRMKEAFPRLKAVVILRNPVDRAISNYRFSRRNGLETLPLEAALRQEERRLREERFPGLSAHPFAYVRRGRYADFLDAYREAFGSDLVVLLFDDLVADPAGTCRRLFRFLEVGEEFVPAGLGLSDNASPAASERDLALSRGTFAELLERFQDSNQRLEQFLGRDLSRWSEVSPLVRGLLSG
jgi:hypothetical protein